MTTSTTIEPNASTDPRPALARALDQAGELISSTDPASAGDPTPCDKYDVAALISHLQAVVRRVGVVVAGEPFDAVGREWAAEPAEWASTWAEGRAATDKALTAAELDRVVAVPWGEATVASAIGSYVGELTTHAWDLAASTGRIGQLDSELAEIALPATLDKIPAHIRAAAEVPFGEVVAVPDDASAYDRLVAWTGRDPHWRP